jgi:hypothetical protein
MSATALCSEKNVDSFLMKNLIFSMNKLTTYNVPSFQNYNICVHAVDGLLNTFLSYTF